MTQTSAPPQSDVIIHSVVPTFLVSDVATTTRWYVTNLGFRMIGAFPKEEPHAYASLMRGPAEIMLLALQGYQKPDLRGRRPTGLWDAYIRVNGVHALYQTVEGKPFIQMPLTHQSYGDWEFEARDPNGYGIVFGGAN